MFPDLLFIDFVYDIFFHIGLNILYNLLSILFLAFRFDRVLGLGVGLELGLGY